MVRDLQPPSPGSFAERGVAAPFTAPMLAGARVRLARRNQLEVVLLNPSGQRGVYISFWAGVRERCRPTVHDALLYERLSAEPSVSPAIARRVARQLAAEGYAGEAAMQAATVAITRDAEDGAAAYVQLLVRLIDQLVPHDKVASAAETPRHAFERRGRLAVANAAATVRQSTAAISAALETLGHRLVPSGAIGMAEPARLTRLVARLRAAAAEVAAWAEANPDARNNGLPTSLADSMAAIAANAATLLQVLQTLTTDVLGTLRLWLANPPDMAQRIERVEWILDGWEQVALLWEIALRPSGQRAALLEMAQLMPRMPPELGTWLNLTQDAYRQEPSTRVISLNDGWRSGAAAYTLIARNEHLRALGI